MNLSNFTIGRASLDEGKVYLGKLSKDQKRWLHKKEITSEFIALMISFVGENKIMDVTENGVPKYEITVKKV